MNVQKNILNMEKSRTYHKSGVTFKVTSNQPSEKALKQFGQKLKSLPYDYQATMKNSYMMGWCG